ncbi:MAG: F0F1 ATP synthase subunit delta, partial [Firmicutes bacterium]|nr:F0F1 ATP synthase subunit delta [Bacillota bacterium]
MKQEVLAKRYARALYQTGADAAALEAALERLTAALELPEGRKLLLSPLIPAAEKEATARRLLAEAVPQAAAETALGLWRVLVAHGREALLPEVREMFHQIRLEAAGETPCEVVTARPLPQDEGRKLVA